jgi:putative intracellular protease/amidase
MWEQGPREDVIRLLHSLHAKEVIIAAICGATLEIARAGLTHALKHTSNSRGYLKAMIPGYRDDDYYVDKLAVTDRNVITASGLGSIEFACGIVTLLNIYSEQEVTELYEMFKNGVIPDRYALSQEC